MNLFWCSPSCRNISGSPNNCLFGSGRGSPHVAMRSVSTVPDACDCDCDWQRELRVDRFAPDLQSTSTGMYKMYSTRSYHQQSIRNGRSFGRLVHIRLAGVFFPELSDAGRYRPPMGVTGKQWETVENSGGTGCFKWLHRDDQPSTWLLENGEPRFCGHRLHMYPFEVQPVSFNPGGTKISPGRRMYVEC